MSSLYSAKMSAYREEGELVDDYQSFSAMAIVGLLISFFSPLAFASTVAAVVPIASTIVCIAALVKISTSRPTLKGKKVALLGLMISLFFAAAGVTYNVSREAALKQQARYVADQWFDAARRGDFPALHQLSLTPDKREPIADQVDELYAKLPEKQVEMVRYTEVEPIPTLHRLKDAIDIKFHSYLNVGLDGRYDRMELLYLFEFEEDGRDKQGFVSLVLQRRDEHRHAEGGWYVPSFRPDYAGPGIHPPPEPTFKGKQVPDGVVD